MAELEHRKAEKMMKRTQSLQTAETVISIQNTTVLLMDVRDLILQARNRVARAVDAELTTLYWHIGQRIRQDILKEKRAEYGMEIVASLARQLGAEFGRGFGVKNMHRMVQFAERYPDANIVSSLLRQLGWTHFTLLLPIVARAKCSNTALTENDSHETT